MIGYLLPTFNRLTEEMSPKSKPGEEMSPKSKRPKTPSDKSDDEEMEEMDEEESEEGKKNGSEERQCAKCQRKYKSKYFYDKHVTAASCKLPVAKKNKVESEASRRQARRVEMMKLVVESQTTPSPGPAQPHTQSDVPSPCDRYEAICRLHPTFRVLQREEYLQHRSMPYNMRQLPAVLLCTLCFQQAINKQHAYLTSMNQKQIGKHLSIHAKLPRPTVVSESRDTSACVGSGNIDYSYVIAFATSNTSANAFVEANKIMGNTTFSSGRALLSSVDILYTEHIKFLREVFQGEQHIAVAFDGGQVLNRHMMASVAYVGQRCYCLPPMFRANAGDPWDSNSLTKALTEMLQVVGVQRSQIRIFMCDGASYNLATIDNLQVVADIIATMADTDGEQVPVIRDRKIADRHNIQSVIQHHAYQEHLCRAHVWKNRIESALTDDHWKLVRRTTQVFAQQFYNAGTRKTRLHCYLRDVRRTKSETSARAVAELLERAQQLQGCIERWPEESQTMWESLKENVLQSFGAVDLDQNVSSSAVKMLVAHVERSHLTDQRRANFALASDTRWHNSCYASVAFITENYELLADWSRGETVPSSVEFCRLMATEGLREQFAEYLQCFSPVAVFLNKISDDAWKPMALTLLEDERRIATKAPGWCKRHFEWVPECAKEHWASTNARLEKISWLDPMKVRVFHKDINFDQKTFMKMCNVEFDEKEWDTYISICHDKSEKVTDAEEFWKNNKGKIPSLYKAAMFLVYLPVVVSRCDVIFSLCGSWFRSNQGNLND